MSSDLDDVVSNKLDRVSIAGGVDGSESLTDLQGGLDACMLMC